MGKFSERMSKPRVVREVVDAITKDASDKGQLIQVGWLTFAAMVYPNGMGQEQRRQLRAAYFGGAQHLFSSIMGPVLEPGAEVTEADMRRMHLIDSELRSFVDECKKNYGIDDDVIPPERTGQTQ